METLFVFLNVQLSISLRIGNLQILFEIGWLKKNKTKQKINNNNNSNSNNNNNNNNGLFTDPLGGSSLLKYINYN